MNTYEFVYIVDAHATQAVKEEITKQVNEALAKSNIKVINSQIWLERHRMSFPINKVSEGTYTMVVIEAQPAALAKLSGLLRINEQILRFMTIRQEAVLKTA